ncbi:MAG: hypothetical protein U9N42_10335 [Campylobacterota bacterium]|nr:hypothetical protein [Campylobacterota bacterium]
MKKAHLNLLVFIFLLAMFGTFFKHIHFSTNLVELLASKDVTRPIDIANELGYSKELFVSVKSFDESSLKKLRIIKAELEKLELINSVELELKPSVEVQEYFKKNYYILADFNSTTLSENQLHVKLEKLYNKSINSFIYEPLNTSDPLGLFEFKVSNYESYLKLDEFGYMLKASTSASLSNMKNAKSMYDEVHEILQKYPDAISFAPFYFLVENSSYIKSDATNIILFSTALLLLLYIVILKNFRLFFHTIVAISSSVLSAILLTSLFFESINIMVLAFGISITTISIDYMFHYYFHNEFSHQHPIKNKKVFLGFLTTVGVFVIFSFIDIKLFEQLSIFSAISLSVAYLLFSYVFIYLSIEPPKVIKSSKKSRDINLLYVMSACVLMLAYASQNLSFDTNIRNLDYQNTKLLSLSEQFSNSLSRDEYQSIIISASTKEGLLQRYEQLAKIEPSLLGIGKFELSKKECQKRLHVIKNYNFTKLKKELEQSATSIGFNNIFKNSYDGLNTLTCSVEVPKNMGFKIAFYDGEFHTLALINEDVNIENMQGASSLHVSKILSKSIEFMKEQLLVFMALSFAFILALLFFMAKSRFLEPLSYVLLPLSSVLFVISLVGNLNIMHLFAIVILVAIGIDYGIYMYNSTTISQTTTAIRYALLSTFAGFGVLIFSSVVALYSIGLVISVGISVIAILLFWKNL